MLTRRRRVHHERYLNRIEYFFNNAEALKINYGDAYPERTSANEEFPVDVIGKSEPVRVDERYFSEIIEARVEQILRKSKEVLDEIDAFELPEALC